LLELKSYRLLHDKRIEQVSSQLERIFTALLGGRPGNSFRRDSCQQLVSEASQLADEMKSAPARYQIILNEEALGQACLSSNERESYRIIDAITGIPLRQQDVAQVSSNGHIGTKLACFSPALVRKGSDGEADVVLRKAELLAVFDHPVVRNRRLH
jgi:hypothetical protein